MTPSTRDRLLATRWVLLDFDGPVCGAFQGQPAPDVAEHLLALARNKGEALSASLEHERDPMQVLRALYRVAPQHHSEIEAALTDAELRSVEVATPTAGVAEFLESCRARGMSLAVVSNNSPESVRAFLERLHLDHLVAAVVGREKSTPELMKPDTYLLRVALSLLGGEPEGSMMIGDSTTDIEAAQAIGAMAVGYANRVGKADCFLELNPELIVSHIGELADALREL